MDLTPEKIFNLFFKFPINYIPIISGESICSFISKAKTLREASDTDFFRKDLTGLLENIFETNETSQFFSHIDALKSHGKLDAIPIIKIEDLSVHILDIRKFNTVFRPIIELNNGHLRQMIEELNLAFFILNSRNEMIYQNKSVAKLHKLLGQETGLRKKSLIDYLPKNFYQNIEESYPDKIYTLRTTNRVLKYKVQSISIDEGTVNLVYFLT